MHPSLKRLYSIASHNAGRDIEAPTELADWLGESPQTINNWADRGVSMKGALKAEALSGYPALAILQEVDGIIPKWLSSATPPDGKLLAHPVSDGRATMPPQIQWGVLMVADLPPIFETQMPDDSMAPRIKAGHIMRFQVSLEPQPGDAVLVTDSGGVPFVRLYRPRRPGHWEAHPLNEAAHMPLDSKQDDLTVLAVLVGVLGRWG